MRFFPIIVLVVVVVAAIGLLATTFPEPTPPSTPVVSATIFPIYDVTRTIAGNRLQVELLIPPGSSPHTFEANPQTAKNIQHSQVIFAVGRIDDWVTQLNHQTPIVTVDKNVTYLEYENTQELDPHYWLSVSNMQGIAQQITAELKAIDPDNADYYQKNLEAYQAELTTLDQELQTTLNQLAYKNIATFHNSWQYFAHDYGINIVTTFEEFPGQAPSPQYLANFADTLEQANVRAVFSEPQLPIDKLAPIAQDHDVSLGVLDPVGGTEERNSYLDLMRYNTNQLKTTLQ